MNMNDNPNNDFDSTTTTETTVQCTICFCEMVTGSVRGGCLAVWTCISCRTSVLLVVQPTSQGNKFDREGQEEENGTRQPSQSPRGRT
ncbi:hypothetical protein IV203_021529 [Nitzschia inconspicua]|uniref:Uncharacterized protein n=1 Tax=Nitzschia inconspicua TaxID=303405 RepID=A0A9K3KH19_9STRA|nr:hypothetical protein IV203_022717 [Nitzschia inconspicua]KAG7343574.1 hypothetical protein IV203_021519 [Nitzschia inconspicua]KAG7343579.1 hypothetical protein IV203_021524 [Nitzschia inconspicua]KAG7343584.1 hypothetical protein IV203_021529 [Nitzschia inconspicua]